MQERVWSVEVRKVHSLFGQQSLVWRPSGTHQPVSCWITRVIPNRMFTTTILMSTHVHSTWADFNGLIPDLVLVASESCLW